MGPACSGAMRIGLLPEVPQPRLIDSDIDNIVTSYLADIWPEFEDISTLSHPH